MKNSLLFLLVAACLFAGCEDDPPFDNGVPIVPVNLSIPVSSPQFVNISVVGGHEQVSGGSRGIILYRLGINEFVALDRHCTYEPSDPCGIVRVDAQTLVLRDNCCNSEFQIFDGAVTEGPATLPLTRYQTSFDGNTLRVFN